MDRIDTVKWRERKVHFQYITQHLTQHSNGSLLYATSFISTYDVSQKNRKKTTTTKPFHCRQIECVEM